MTSGKRIQSLIDEVAIQYEDCWSILYDIKNFKKPDDNNGFFERLVSFQPLLCEALLKLEKVFQRISKEENDLIVRKGSLNAKWFAARMAKLAEYKKMIESCISIGKCLGDSFAWSFYYSERELLLEHLKHEELFHLPSGKGGIAELEFVKQIKLFRHYFIIYHGITSILRYGDFSLFDLHTKKIVSIGEIKSGIPKPKGPGVYEVELTVLFGTPIDKLKTFGKELGFPDQSNLAPLPINLRPKERDRLGRQLKGIADSLEAKERNADFELISFGDRYVSELSELLKKTKRGSFISQRAGKGLVLIAYKNRVKKLSAKLGSKSDHTPNIPIEIRDQVESTMDGVAPGKAILFRDSLCYNFDAKTQLYSGTVPFFWWPINIDFIKAIIFQDIIVPVLYNSGQLIGRLENEGYRCTLQENGQYKVEIQIEGRPYTLVNFHYFIRLVVRNLYKEDTVVEMIKRTVDLFTAKNLPPNSSIAIHLNEFI